MTAAQVTVRLGDEEYALPVERVLEIAETGPLTPVPGAPAGVLGVRNLRGQVMPIADLAAVLGLGSAGEPGRVVVVEEGERRAGLVVDDVLDVAVMAQAQESTDAPYLRGSVLRDGTLVGMVDVEAVLGGLTYGEPGG